jgi:hypothetical protein
VKNKLKALRQDLARPERSSRDYTLGQVVEDWLSEGMPGRSAQTVAKYRDVLRSVLREIGDKALADLTAADVRAPWPRLREPTRPIRSASRGSGWSGPSGTPRSTTSPTATWPRSWIRRGDKPAVLARP